MLRPRAESPERVLAACEREEARYQRIRKAAQELARSFREAEAPASLPFWASALRLEADSLERERGHKERNWPADRRAPVGRTVYGVGVAEE